MKRNYVKVACPDEDIYLCEDDGFYDLYIENPYYKENKYIDDKPIVLQPTYNEVKDRLPEIFWENHKDNIDAYNFAWEKAFEHIRIPTEQNDFIRSYIDTSFNGNTFMGDSSSMMSFTKYANHIFDFTGTLENFYHKQHIDGFICREIRGDNGKDRFHRHDPITTGPHWLAFEEWELYKFYGNKERIAKVFAPLMAYHAWLKKFRTNPDGSYWCTGLSSTMDNQPRVPDGYSRRLDSANESWNDINLMMIIDNNCLINMAKLLDREDEVKENIKERDFLVDYILKHQWDKKDEFFYNTLGNGDFLKCKTAGAFWALYIDELPKEISEKLVKHALNKDEFNRFNPFPSISADHPMYDPNGLYWRGGVWSCMEVMILKGLARHGYHEEAFDCAYRHNDAVVKEFVRDGTLWEVYAPDSLDRSLPSGGDFVGWTGISVISIVLEFVFGIVPHPIEGYIDWYVNLTDEFGVKKYFFNGQELTLKCEHRNSKEEEPIIFVTGGKAKVKIHWNGKEKELIF